MMSRMLSLLFVGLSMSLAHSAWAETFSVDNFSKSQICACDCVFQYRAAVDLAKYESVRCQALYDNGEWADIKQNEYAGPDLLIFLSPKEIWTFECEGTLAALVQ